MGRCTHPQLEVGTASLAVLPAWCGINQHLIGASPVVPLLSFVTLAPAGRVIASPYRRRSLSDHTYRLTEIVGSSTDGVDQAIRNGVARASQTLRNLEWFEVGEIRGHLEDGQVRHVQVTMKVGFRIDGQ